MAQFFEELKRRKVTRVAIAYLISAWVLMQVTDVLSPILELPAWVPKLVFLLLALGFIPALILAWAYELTPSGIRRDASMTAQGDAAPTALRYTEHAVLVIVALAIVGATVYWYMNRNVRWVRNEALPQIEAYVDEGDFEAAFTLALKAQSVAPNDADLLAQWERFAWLVSLPSDPPGATVYRRGYADPDSEWIELGGTPIHNTRLPFGLSLLRIELDGYRQLTRVIGHGFSQFPSLAVADRSQATRYGIGPERYLLDPSERLPQDMVRVPGTTIAIEGELIRLNDFFIDRFEVTNREYQEFVDAGAYQRRDLWVHEFLLDGENVSWESAIARFTDRTGRPGPATWEAGHFPDGQEDHPVTGISWYEAAAYARYVGRDLPSIHHWRRAFALGMLTWLLPASNVDGERVAAVGDYDGIGWTGTYDMAGNAREWCFNAIGDQRAMLGGAWNESAYAVQESIQDPGRVSSFDRSVANGFRLIAAADGARLQSRFYAEISEPNQYVHDEPASDEVINAYLDAFDYDSGPLHAAIEETRDDRFWVRETISLDAGYNDERIALYLYLPKIRTVGTPRFQIVVYWPGSSALYVDSVDNLRVHLDFILKNGRAVAIPVLQGMFQRRRSAVPAWSTIAARDMTIQQIRDLRRSIDYLETRTDIDATKLGFYGLSWGGRMGALALAAEPRFKVGVLNQAGFEPNVHPAIDSVHYVTRVTQPVLQFNGRHDADFRFESQAKPFFDLLATPDANKKHVVEPTGHFVPQPVYVGETLDWLDKYLGPPGS